MYSRQTSTVRVKCLACDWSGLEKDLTHTYKFIPPDDTEAVSYCPQCGNEDLDFDEDVSG